MGTPAESFLGEIEVERWLGPGMRGGVAALDPSAAPPPAPGPVSLSGMAGGALDFLLRAPRLNQDFACWRLLILSSCPFHPACGDPGEGEDTECRISSALPAARIITGATGGDETDRRLIHRLLGFPREASPPGVLGRLLLALSESYARTGDRETRAAARQIFLSLKERSQEKWDLAFFPPGAAGAAGTAHGSPVPGRLSDGSAAAAVLAYGTVSADAEAVELARELARGVMTGLPEGSFSGETQPRAMDAWSVAEVAATLGDREMILWAQRAFDFLRSASSDTGFVPWIIPAEGGPSPGAAGLIGDTCSTACLTGAAVSLGRAGLADYYDHAERFVRNQLRSVQFAALPGFAEWYRQRHAARPRESVEAALASIQSDCTGGFLSHVAPTDRVHQDPQTPPLLMATCCSAEAVRALAAVWRSSVTEAEGTVDVNMGFDRETEFVAVRAAPPREGRLTVAVHKPCTLRFRPLSWTDRSGLTVQRSGSPAMFSFDAGYVVLEELHAGETVTVRWPVPVFTQKLALPGTPSPLKWSWEGCTVAGVEPRGAHLPLF